MKELTGTPRIIGWIIMFIVCVLAFGLMGSDEQGFRIFGRNGGFTLCCAMGWFINTLFFIWALWHALWGNSAAKQLAWVTFIIGLILLFTVEWSYDVKLGEAKKQCRREYFSMYEKNGEMMQRLWYCEYELVATPDMIDQIVTCPKCGEKKRVDKFWW